MGRHKAGTRNRGLNTPKRVGMFNQEKEDTKLRLTDATHIVNKNSRTITKVMQLLELKGKLESEEAKEMMNRKIEYLKARIERRLVKLAKWGDDPHNDDKVRRNEMKGKKIEDK